MKEERSTKSMEPDSPISLRVHGTYPNNIVSKQQKSTWHYILHCAIFRLLSNCLTNQITNKSCLDVMESN